MLGGVGVAEGWGPCRGGCVEGRSSAFEGRSRRGPRLAGRAPALYLRAMSRILDIADRARLPGRFVALARGVTALD